jgi:hypothetical protein
MLFLSSYQQESEKMKNKVMQNIRFILSHFKELLFPRTITSRSTTRDGTQFKVVYYYQEDSKGFLICNWCFWCASHLNMRNVITKCPACDNDGMLNSIPISDKEVYEINSSQR